MFTIMRRMSVHICEAVTIYYLPDVTHVGFNLYICADIT